MIKKMKNAPSLDVQAELLCIDLARDHLTKTVTEDELENLDNNDEAAAAEVNCEFGELP